MLPDKIMIKTHKQIAEKKEETKNNRELIADLRPDSTLAQAVSPRLGVCSRSSKGEGAPPSLESCSRSPAGAAGPAGRNPGDVVRHGRLLGSSQLHTTWFKQLRISKPALPAALQ